MQKKKAEILGFKLLVFITFSATNDPNKKAPLSPKKILAFGKLNNKKESRIIIWAIRKNENSKLALLRFMYVKIILISNKLIVNKPLKPSTKFAPIITNNKHNNTNTEDKNWFSNKKDRRGKSM